MYAHRWKVMERCQILYVVPNILSIVEKYMELSGNVDLGDGEYHIYCVEEGGLKNVRLK